MSLTVDQSKKLANNTRRVRPTYYNTDTNETYQITNSTENALILLSSTAKKKAVDYIKKLTVTSTSKSALDYTALLREVVTQQVDNSAAIQAELSLITGSFNTFLNSFSGQLDSAGETIQSGMQPILSAMTRGMGRLKDIDQNEYYHRMFNEAVEAQFSRDSEKEIQKELRSWIRVLVSYP